MAVTRYSFSYCGIPCEKFGLTYIPDAKDRAFDETEYTPITETVTGRVGSNWFGNTVKDRTFSQLCFYENLTPGQIEDMLRWMHKNTVGELRFADRPWCYYIVRPSKKPTSENYRTYDCNGTPLFSGKITFNLTCHEGYARIDTSNLDLENWNYAVESCGLLTDDMMPQVEVKTGQQIVYNPGTETTTIVKISLAGTAPDGITIGNYTTGDVCKLVSLPANKTLIINSEIGTVTYEDSGDYAFSLHNYGYITLAGCGMFRRNVPVKTTAGSNVIVADAAFYKGVDEGKYIYIEEAWNKILYVQDAYHVVVDKALAQTSDYSLAMIAQMNEIYITGDNVSLTKFEIEYTPLVR